VTAHSAHDFGFQLTMEEINHNALVPENVIFPCLLSHLDVWPASTVLQLRVNFVVHSVQILMQTIQQKSKKLLRIVLLKSIESRCILADGKLSIKGNKLIS
jgi:hypothetical protein